MDPTVRLAIATVEAEYPEHCWHELPSSLRVSLIYDEIRRLDLAFCALRKAEPEQEEPSDGREVALFVPGGSFR